MKTNLLWTLLISFLALTMVMACDDSDDDEDDSSGNSDNDDEDDDDEGGDNEGGDDEEAECESAEDCDSVVCDCLDGPVNFQGCIYGECVTEDNCEEYACEE